MITINDIKQARLRITPYVHIPPTLNSNTLSSLSGNNLFFKCEHLQKTGSFKMRGATNKLLSVAEKGAKHIVAASSGNHGQAVASIAKRVGLPAIIVVPKDIVAAKDAAIRSYGATVVYCGKTSGKRIEKAKELMKAHEGMEYIPPYDDPLIMAGQGTIGLEILKQIEDIDIVYVPIGGGGLIAGILTAIKESKPSVQVIGVEPVGANDTYLSRERGEITSIGHVDTAADGLRTSQPGELTFPILQKYLDDLVLVSELEIKQAFTYMLQRMKQVIEPSGAVSVAAALAGGINTQGKNVCAVLSGGNIDLAYINKM